MRWLSFRHAGAARFGVVDDAGTGVIDATGQFVDLKSAIEADALASLAADLAGGDAVPLAEIEYLPVIPNPSKILCVGLNYKAHQEETGRGGEGVPTIFVRFANAQIGHGQPMLRPPESASLDFEGEIALVIGKPGRRIPRASALDHVAGYSIYNDGSVRQFQRATSQFTPGKNFGGTGPFGPWLMTPDEVGDIDEMEITTRLNGEVMQNAKASLIVHDFSEIIEYCSTFTELVPGDVLVTGTPGGVGDARDPKIYMDDGDVIEVEVTPIGKLVNPVVAES